jgi:hypothetical protein
MLSFVLGIVWRLRGSVPIQLGYAQVPALGIVRN